MLAVTPLEVETPDMVVLVVVGARLLEGETFPETEAEVLGVADS